MEQEVTAVSRVEDQVAKFRALSISDAKGDEMATNALSIIAGMRKGLKEAWKKEVDPHKANIQQIDSAYKPALARLDGVEAYLKGEILNWRRHEALRIEKIRRDTEAENRRIAAEAAEIEAQKKADVAAKAAAEAKAAGFTEAESATLGQLEAADVAPVPVVVHAAPPPPPKFVQGGIGGSTIVKTWTYEVEDESLVPAQYRVVHKPLITAAVRAGVRSIPGVRIFQDESIRRA